MSCSLRERKLLIFLSCLFQFFNLYLFKYFIAHHGHPGEHCNQKKLQKNSLNLEKNKKILNVPENEIQRIKICRKKHICLKYKYKGIESLPQTLFF